MAEFLRDNMSRFLCVSFWHAKRCLHALLSIVGFSLVDFFFAARRAVAEIESIKPRTVYAYGSVPTALTACIYQPMIDRKMDTPKLSFVGITPQMGHNALCEPFGVGQGLIRRSFPPYAQKHLGG